MSEEDKLKEIEDIITLLNKRVKKIEIELRLQEIDRILDQYEFNKRADIAYV